MSRLRICAKCPYPLDIFTDVIFSRKEWLFENQEENVVDNTKFKILCLNCSEQYEDIFTVPNKASIIGATPIGHKFLHSTVSVKEFADKGMRWICTCCGRQHKSVITLKLLCNSDKFQPVMVYEWSIKTDERGLVNEFAPYNEKDN